MDSAFDPAWLELIKLGILYFRVALNDFVAVRNRVYSLLIQIHYQIRLAHVRNLLFFAANALRVDRVLIVAKLSVQVVAGNEYYLQASVVIISDLLSDKLEWVVVVPVEAKHATIGVISYILKQAG